MHFGFKQEDIMKETERIITNENKQSYDGVHDQSNSTMLNTMLNIHKKLNTMLNIAKQHQNLKLVIMIEMLINVISFLKFTLLVGIENY